jgi:hypothetical protein
MNLDLKKVYYYVIALIAFFVLLWGTIDFVSASAGMITGKYVKVPPSVEKNAEPGLEEYYQQRVAQDRLFDSLARIMVSGVVFAYSKFKLAKSERS